MVKKLLLVLSALLLCGVLLLTALALHGPLKITNFSVLINAITGSGIASPPAEVWQRRLAVPEGYYLSVYAADLPMVRFMAFSEGGDLLASRPRAGEVVLLERDRSGNGLPEGRRVLLDQLTRPHGLAFHDGYLYIAESNAIGRVAFDSATGQLAGEYQHIVQGLPDTGNHWTKTIGFGPDGKLYLSIGSSCNTCEEKDERRATMMRFDADGGNGQLFATGLRNSVGFAWAPWDGSLYATDNGRDLLGDDFPPDELNRVTEGKFYGWPYINGFGDLDPDLGEGREDLLAIAIDPVHGFAAHNAALGMVFFEVPTDAQARSALVALHGSWNRSVADGYKVVQLTWQEDGSIDEGDFLVGFEQQGDVIGRPVDVVQGPGGDIFVSDDYGGVIYRVSYGVKRDSLSLAREEQRRDALDGIPAAEREQLSQQGAGLYARYGCAACHEGEGATASSLQGLDQRYHWSEIDSLLQTPTPPMPVFPLDAQQRRALAVYLLGSPTL